MDRGRPYRDEDYGTTDPGSSPPDAYEDARLLSPGPSIDASWHLENGGPLNARPRSLLRKFLSSLRSTSFWRRRGHCVQQESLDRPTKSTARAWRRRWGFRICFVLPVSILTLFGVVHVINFLLGLGPMVWDDGSDDFFPHWGQPGQPGEGLAEYPTDFTRDVLPIPCHSHNDYWRRVPLYEALHYGCTGVEADVWLHNNELYVGHNLGALATNRTFRNLYVDPLVELLDKQNPSTQFANVTHHGVFDVDPEQTLILLVDFKTSGKSLWPVVLDQLSGLRDKNYLTYYNGSKVMPGPITVVATGNAPFELVAINNTYRDVFFDAPLWSFREKHAPKPESMSSEHQADEDVGESAIDPDAFNATNSYYASTSFRYSIGTVWWGRLTQKQIDLIRGYVQGAHSRGLKARFWDTPGWPIGLRNYIWTVLVREGADYLNVDDLKAASKRNWKKKAYHPNS